MRSPMYRTALPQYLPDRATDFAQAEWAVDEHSANVA